MHDLALHVLFDLGLRVVAPSLGEPVPQNVRFRLKHDDEVEPALREEVAAVEVDDAAAGGERVLEGVDDLFWIVLWGLKRGGVVSFRRVRKCEEGKETEGGGGLAADVWRLEKKN